MLFLGSCGGSPEQVATTGDPATGMEGAELFRSLRGGGYVVYFRHAIANVGEDTRGEAPAGWWLSCDSAQARQLSDEGRAQAREVGKRLSQLNLPLTGIFTSEFCRCQETAQMMGLKELPIQGVQELTGGVYPHDDAYLDILRFASEKGGPESVLVLVGHSLHSDSNPPELEMGDAAIYRWHEVGDPQLVTVLSPDEWPAITGDGN